MGKFISTGSATSRSARSWLRKSKRCWTRKRRLRRRRRLKKIPRRSRRQNPTRKRNRRRTMEERWQAVSRGVRGENIKFQSACFDSSSGVVFGNSSVDTDCGHYRLRDQRRESFHFGGTGD